MKLASYLATRPGIQGIANRAIRFRFGGNPFKDGVASHSEVIFEPGDGVDHLMPDGTCEPDENGALWCASAVAREEMPVWSKKRAGKTGGVRFKRIKIIDSVTGVVVEPNKWEVNDYHRNPLEAAQWYVDHEGDRYDWSMALGWLNWPIQVILKQLSNSWACSQSTAAAGGYPRPDFYHPELMRSVVTPNL